MTPRPRFSLPWKRSLELHESCGAHVSGLGTESMGTANTRREKSLLMNRMAYATKQISRNGKRKWEKEIVNFSLEIYSNKTWEVGEQGTFLDLKIKMCIFHPHCSSNKGLGFQIKPGLTAAPQ